MARLCTCGFALISRSSAMTIKQTLMLHPIDNQTFLQRDLHSQNVFWVCIMVSMPQIIFYQVSTLRLHGRSSVASNPLNNLTLFLLIFWIYQQRFQSFHATTGFLVHQSIPQPGNSQTWCTIISKSISTSACGILEHSSVTDLCFQ